MEALQIILANIQAASTGLLLILYTLLAASGLDLISGTWAAWKSNTFDSRFFPEFIKTHIVTKVVPILLVLVAGVALGGTNSAGGIATVATGGTMALAYLESMVSSIKGNIDSGNEGTKGLPSSVKIEAVPITSQPLTDAADGS